MGICLDLPGTSGNYASCPDTVALSFTGDIDLRVKFSMPTVTPATQMVLVACWGTSNQMRYSFEYRVDGSLALRWSATGSTQTGVHVSSTQAFFDGVLAPREPAWCRVAFDVNNGAAGNTATFYTSIDGTDWIELGAAQTLAGTTTLFNSSAVTTVGDRANGPLPFKGQIYEVQILEGIAGTVRANPDFTDTAQWADGDDAGDTGSDGIQTWTLAGAATIDAEESNVAGALVLVQAGFGRQPFSVATTWADITDDVRAISTNRGRNAELDRFDAGTATFEIDNTTGWYHSHNTASPYYPNVRPMVPIRVRAVWDGTIYPIWSGFVERWPVNFPGNIESVVTVDAVDLFKALALADASQPDRAALVDPLLPVAWWRFNDDTDSGPVGTHDLIVTGATTGNPGVWTSDQAGTFDGVDDFATVVSEADIELRSDMSIEMWLRPERSTALTVTNFNTPGLTSWVAPAGVTSVMVEVWGSGAGGAAAVGANTSGGGGGGAGYVKGVMAVTPGVSYDVYVGAGGAGGVDGSEDGSDGDTSYFGDAEILANGGVGSAPSWIYGGGGGPVGGSAGNILRTAGGRGGDGTLSGAIGGGGGGGGGAGGSVPGSAGRSHGLGLAASAPNGDIGALGGQGGGSVAGDGGNGGNGNPATNGVAGTAPGGGGGGGGSAVAGGDGNGGAGAAGRVTVSYAVAELMVPLSARGASSDNLYNFTWDGLRLRFAPSSSAEASYIVGNVLPDEWSHIVVTIDWLSAGGRIVKGYIDGVLTLNVSTGYTPGIAARAVAVGRRATDNDRYFKGDISEIAIYDHILTAQDVSNLYAAQLEGFETQLTGARVEYVLGTAEVGVGIELTDFDLDAGQTVISGPNSPTEVTALEAIQIAADTEFGSFFIAGDGTPTFQDRYHRMVDMATPVATIDETDYETLHLLGKDDLKVANDVRVAPSDSAEPFIVRDGASQDIYGRRTLELTVYPDDQNEAFDMATWLLALFKEPKDDIASIPFRLYEEVTDFPTLLGAELGDRYNIEAPLAGDDLDLDVYLERISHNIDQVSWTMDWGVTPAGEAETFWLLGVAGFSELGETTVLGF